MAADEDDASASRCLKPVALPGLGGGGAGERGGFAVCAILRGPVGGGPGLGVTGEGVVIGFSGEFAPKDGGPLRPPTYSDRLRNGGGWL